MNRIVFTIVAVTVIAAGLISLAIQHSTRGALLQRSESRHRQAEEIAALLSEGQRLSNQVVQVNNPRPLSQEDLAELLRLRSEVGQLRESTGRWKELESSNEKVRAVIARSDEQLAQARSAPNFWPKDQLSFVGYATPEAAVRSMLWAMNNRDVENWQSICTSEAWAELKDENRMSDAEREASIKSMARDLVSPSFGFHVVEQKLTAPDRAVVTVSFDGEGKTRKFVLRKIGNDWKFQELIFAGQTES